MQQALAQRNRPVDEVMLAIRAAGPLAPAAIQRLRIDRAPRRRTAQPPKAVMQPSEAGAVAEHSKRSAPWPRAIAS